MALKQRNTTKIVGIDLAGSPRRPTGYCLIDGARVSLKVLFTDDEIMEDLSATRPELVAVDAPLSLPPGRRTIDEHNGVHFRPCDLELRKRGLKFFPVTIGPMRMLTERGIKIKERLEKIGVSVIEIYPGGAQDIWGLPRAKQNPKLLQSGLLAMLRKSGLRLAGSVRARESFLPDELDALTAALVGWQYWQRKAEIYGLEPWIIVMPAGKKN